MNIMTLLLPQLLPAPWRFSEDRSIGHSQYEKPTPIQENIIHSMQSYGQIAPIHVRPHDTEINSYEIIDGHIVVDAAKILKLPSLDVICHLVDKKTAIGLSLYLNLNRGGQYGQRHVKIMRVFKQYLEAGGTRNDLAERVAWPASRVDDYLAIDEQGTSWRRFMFVTDDVSEHQPAAFDDTTDLVAQDN